jgi:uncharacterized integral membrane protein
LLRTLGTNLKWATLLPIFLAVVLLAVANDQSVTVNLNPFDKSDPALKVELALYQIAFLIFVLGVLFGGLIVWTGQRRRRLRNRRAETPPWQARADWPEERKPRAAASEVSAFLPRPERG